MKKLNLKKMNLLSEDVIERSQMAAIYGGSGGSGTGTCGYQDPSGYTVCNLTMSQAMSYQATYGGYYCCDSCGGNGGSASYC
ncbi:TIGR04149 family rSAM-modified RiPP [Algoriphagus aestuarii]|nr:TIGR04149 family rSAM-modified RiPP [Algoriphagus aestuarii]